VTLGIFEYPIRMVATEFMPIHPSRKGKGNWFRVGGMCLLRLMIFTLGKFLPGSIYRPLPPLPHNPIISRKKRVLLTMSLVHSPESRHVARHFWCLDMLDRTTSPCDEVLVTRIIH